MKNINSLEISKQEELNKILEIILSFNKDIKPEKIIAFGEYINGKENIDNLVREGDELVKYTEELKIILVTRKPTQEKNLRISRNIISKIKNTGLFNNPLEIIIDDIYNFKQSLKEKSYFYLDLLNNGISLYDSEKYKFETNIKLTKTEIEKIRKQNFENWSSLAGEFYIDYKNAFNRGSFNIATFYLHQSFEIYMTCYILVKTGYKPKTHDLEHLYSKLKQYSKEFNNIFDLNKENKMFEFIKVSYINSRYDKGFNINVEYLNVLENKLVRLSRLVEKLCLKEINK